MSEEFQKDHLDEYKRLLTARIETSAYQSSIEKILSLTKAENSSQSISADKLKRRLIYINFLTLICIFFLVVVQAKESITSMGVSATVVPSAKMLIIHQEKKITISQEDIDTGYKDIPSAFTFSINTNSTQGFILDFIPVGTVFDSVKIAGISNLVQLNATGGSIVQRGFMTKDITYQLGFKFKLNEAILPGQYPWPLQLNLHVIY